MSNPEFYCDLCDKKTLTPIYAVGGFRCPYCNFYYWVSGGTDVDRRVNKTYQVLKQAIDLDQQGKRVCIVANSDTRVEQINKLLGENKGNIQVLNPSIGGEAFELIIEDDFEGGEW